MKKTTHRFFAPLTQQEETKNVINLMLIIDDLVAKVEFLKSEVKYLNDVLKETQEAQTRMEQDIYRLQQKI